MMELNFTPKQLAKELNLTEDYILKIERGEKNISLLSLYRISKVLKTHPSEIVKGLK
jgi:transcriptional regulator with XRE-family HTH domain